LFDIHNRKWAAGGILKSKGTDDEKVMGRKMGIYRARSRAGMKLLTPGAPEKK
jgi:hypothetical protein